AAGLTFLLTVPLIEASVRLDAAGQRRILTRILIMGAVLRAAMLWSVPALEDDFYRYLWDGAMSANGFNPYGLSPAAVASTAGPAGDTIRDLSEQAGYVFERINNPELRTVYPPVAQAFFALAYLAEPWSLLAWRLIILAAECVSLCLLLAMLRDVGRPAIWVALYWLNPLIIKELVNSAHMEAILMPLVLGAVWFAMQQRFLASVGLLALAAGTKVWPLLLAPLLVRPLLSDPRRLALALGLLGASALALAAPILMAGLDRGSGFVAYSGTWQRNGALVPGLTALSMALAGLANETAASLVRIFVAATAALIAIALAIRPVAGSTDLVGRVTVMAAAVLLLSPAQYPWYLAWVMPMLVFRPIRGLLAATALLPVYYASFHFRTQGIERVYDGTVVWLIWLPIWFMLWREWRQHTAKQSNDRAAPVKP
ncbi:MAG: glycosyltransferase 87 family protein, partial [Hyphomicrobiaceae bacterium]|nr:glycosyltransferase 87 family protein [Hyphomicrobiaceae bacterium]